MKRAWLARSSLALEKVEKKQKQRERARQERQGQTSRFAVRAKRLGPLVIAALVVVVAGGWWLQSRTSLPPIDMSGHIERWPPSLILSEPIPEIIQKHILEHISDEGPPGVMAQYNCEKYSCDPDLVDKLEVIVRDYSPLVYLAPSAYDGKIILSKLGRRRVLNEFDEAAIRNFIQ